MSAVRQIVLIGLSGVGKSTVGKALAERLDWAYLDTDDLVTEQEGRTPAQIIDTDGEPAFRAIEERVVAEAGGDLDRWRRVPLSKEPTCARRAGLHLLPRCDIVGDRRAVARQLDR